jgi:hypothetical protein
MRRASGPRLRGSPDTNARSCRLDGRQPPRLEPVANDGRQRATNASAAISTCACRSVGSAAEPTNDVVIRLPLRYRWPSFGREFALVLRYLRRLLQHGAHHRRASRGKFQMPDPKQDDGAWHAGQRYDGMTRVGRRGNLRLNLIYAPSQALGTD